MDSGLSASGTYADNQLVENAHVSEPTTRYNITMDYNLQGEEGFDYIQAFELRLGNYGVSFADLTTNHPQTTSANVPNRGLKSGLLRASIAFKQMPAGVAAYVILGNITKHFQMNQIGETFQGTVSLSETEIKSLPSSFTAMLKVVW